MPNQNWGRVDELCSRTGILTAWDELDWISAMAVRQWQFGTRVFSRLLKQKAEMLITNWASSLEFVVAVAYDTIVYQTCQILL